MTPFWQKKSSRAGLLPWMNRMGDYATSSLAFLAAEAASGV